MSQKNKLENKQTRWADRMARRRPERRPASDIDLESSAAVLADCKQKLNRRARRYLRASRASLLVMPEPVVRPAAVKLMEKLASLKLTQVIRRRSQFATRAAGAKYRLEALSPDSRFRPALQAIQDANIRAFKAAEAELSARKLPATNQLA